MNDDQAVPFIELHFLNSENSVWIERDSIIALADESADGTEHTSVYTVGKQVFAVKENIGDVFRLIADAIAADVDGVTHETD